MLIREPKYRRFVPIGKVLFVAPEYVSPFLCQSGKLCRLLRPRKKLWTPAFSIL